MSSDLADWTEGGRPPSTSDPDPIQPKRSAPGGKQDSASIGPPDAEDHQQIVRSIVEFEQWSRDTLSDPFSKMQSWWELYLAKKRDRRKEGEKWRANVAVPYPYSGVETTVAALTDILLSADPPIQADAVGAEDEEDAKAIERLLDYTFRRNRWPSCLDLMLRSACIQGTEIPKLVWGKKAQRVYVRPWAKDIADWKKAVSEAEIVSNTKAPGDPRMFEEWRKNVNTARYGKVPEWPIAAYQEIVDYEGPMISRESIFSFRFDPFIEEIQDQEVFIQRVVKTKTWLYQNTGDGADKPFDPIAVEVALSGYNGERFSEWQDGISQMMGVDPPQNDPRYADAVELWEVWRKDAQNPFLVILNRVAIISKPDRHGCHSMPYHHGQLPYFPIRNVPIQGHFLGISEIQPNEALYKEMNSLRDLRLDAVTLSVLPIFMRMVDSGIPELAHLLSPGMVFPSSRPDGIQQLLKYQPNIMDAFREIMEIKADIDETNATPPSLRGGPSTVGRVSATESERRFGQAIVRQKQKVLRIEGELSPAVRQAQMLWLQFGSAETRIRVGGSDPYLQISRRQLMNSIDMDFRFRGASKAVNRDLAAQELMAFAKTFINWLTIPETRSLMKRVYENMGQRGIEAIVSEKGTQELLMKAGMAPRGAPGAPGGGPEGGLEAAMAAAQGGQPGAPAAPEGDQAQAMADASGGAGGPGANAGQDQSAAGLAPTSAAESADAQNAISGGM